MNKQLIGSLLLLTLLTLLPTAAGAHGDLHTRIQRTSAEIDAHPGDVELHLKRGELFAAHAEFDRASTDFAHVRRLAPDLDIVDFVEGRMLGDAGRYETAAVLLERYLRTHPKHGTAHLERARALGALGRPAEALREFELGIALSERPGPEVFVERARQQIELGKRDEALHGLLDGLRRTGGAAALKARARELGATEEQIASTRIPTSATGTAGLAIASPPASTQQAGVVVGFLGAMRYRANISNPGAIDWTAPDFIDTGWSNGFYGVGYGAGGIIKTTVPVGTSSVYTRASFDIVSAGAVQSLILGVDYDDGITAWINGIEVYRSPEMPAGTLFWNTVPGLHESSNAGTPHYPPRLDISTLGIPALVDGENILAIGVWNRSTSSSDLALAPELAVDPVPLVERGPYLQRGSEDAVVIRWRTTAPTDSRVLYGTQLGGLGSMQTVPGERFEHEVALTNLQAATSYYYAVGSSTSILAGDDAEHVFTTAPTPGSTVPTRVWVLGDSGTANANARAVRDSYLAWGGGIAPDLWLMLGDNAYPDGTDAEHERALFDMYPSVLQRSVLWPTLGNHDGHTADSATQSGPYYDIFTLPTSAEAGGLASGTEAYYSFDYANVHFVCLESYETTRTPGSPMLSWLEQDLAASDADWLIAFWHHPPYSMGSHNSDSETQLVEMRQYALPILEAHGVDLVLCGHSHSYERSYLLDGHYGTTGSFEESMKWDAGDGRPDGDGAYAKPGAGGVPHQGAVYAVAGSSGQISGGSLDHPVMFTSLNELGSMVLDFDGSRLDARFLDDARAVRDSFTIIRQFPPVDRPNEAETLARSGLSSVHPNPFNPRVQVAFDLAAPGRVEMDVYDLRGQHVRTLTRDHFDPGRHVLQWQGRDDDDHAVASGVYLLVLRAGQTVDQRKISLVR